MKKFLIWWCICSVGIFIFVVSGALVATMQAITAALLAVNWYAAGYSVGNAIASVLQGVASFVIAVIDLFR